MIGALSFGGGYGMVSLVPIFLQPHNLWRSFVYYGQPHGAVKCSSDYAVVHIIYAFRLQHGAVTNRPVRFSSNHTIIRKIFSLTQKSKLFFQNC